MAKSTVPSATQKFVRERAFGYCEYCYAPSGFSPDTFPNDHIHPESLGGSSDPNNLALSCGGCNGHKYNKTKYPDPLTNQPARLFHPRKDYWPDHFQWNEDETMIIGITPVGRATVSLLDVNRESNVNLRILLKIPGLHPPKEYPKV